MKRFFIPVLVLLLILSVFPVSAHSPRVVDEAGLLTEDEIIDLTAKAQTISDTYQIDIVIVTVNSLGGKTAIAFADDYYDEHDYGNGIDYSGALLLLSMEYRDYAISTSGEAIQALTDSALESVENDFLPWLGKDNYYMGFLTFLESVENYYDAYRNGVSTDQYPGDYDDPDYFEEEPEDLDFIACLLLGLVAGAAVGGISLLVMRSKMNTAKQQYDATSYIKENSFDLFRCQDLFLYSRTSKTRRSSDSGGSSVHTSSSGRSHGGSSGKF